MSGFRFLVVALGLAGVACARSDDLENTGDSGARRDGTGATTAGGVGGSTGTGASGGSGPTTTTGTGGVGGAGGRGGSPSTGVGGAGGLGGGTGTGGSGTGGAGGTGGGGPQDASVADVLTPIDAGTCTTCKLRVQYRASDTNPTDNQIKPHFNIVNVGTTSIPLRELVLRYWFTADGDRPQLYSCDYAMIACSNVTGKIVKMTMPEQGADSYLEIGFGASAGTLAPNGQTGEIQNRFNKDNYSNYNEADDYSFDPSRTTFTDWMRVTLYHNGGLVWGIDPECANPRDGSMCGADAGIDVNSSDAEPDVATPDAATPDVGKPDSAKQDGSLDVLSPDGAGTEDSDPGDSGD
jgi:hypothetical protein